MNRREHYLEAERLLELASKADTLAGKNRLTSGELVRHAAEIARDQAALGRLYTRAQIHATLASVDATVAVPSRDIPIAQVPAPETRHYPGPTR